MNPADLDHAAPPRAACGGPAMHVLRRYDTGELAGSEKDAVAAHVASCASCESVLREFVAERAALKTTLPFPAVEARITNRGTKRSRRAPWWQWIWAPALATIALAVMLPMRGTDPENDAAIRIKGRGLEFVVKTADGVRDGRDGEALKAGDQLRVRYHAQGRRYVLVVGVDADGQVFPYVVEGDRSAPAETGRVLANAAIQLDSDTRPERVFALFSDAPIAIDEVRAVARDAVRDAGGHVETVARLPVPDVREQDSVLLNKASP